MHNQQKDDQKILNRYLPQLQKRLKHIAKIDMTYVPPAVLRYDNGSPYAIVFDTTDDNHYHYDINKNKLSNVRDLQWT